MQKIAITLTTSNLTKKVKQHLAVIGKRAKDTNGNPLYSDITTSTAEDAKIWTDMYDSAIEEVIASLSALDCYYTSDTDNETITMTFGSQQWDVLGEEELASLKKALQGSIEKYVWNRAIYQYLDIIHPSTGDKYPPIFARPYVERTEKLLLVIQEIANSCFIKSDPWKVEYPYPTFIDTLGTEVQIEVGEDATISYSIDIDAKDDIDICPSNSTVTARHLNHEMVIHGNREGTCYCTIYSRHDEVRVSKVLKVIVAKATKERRSEYSDGFPHLH